MKILHLLYTSLPEKSGSSIRSHNLLSNQKKQGFEISVLVAPFIKNIHSNQTYTFENINYKLTKSNLYTKSENISGLKEIYSKAKTIFNFFNLVKNEIKNDKPDVIHTHSMFYCAFVGICMSWYYKIPHVYEVRSFWELRTRSQSKIKFKIFRFFENLAILLSDKIVVISSSMKKDIQNRGKSFKKKSVEIIYNTVGNEDIENANKIINDFNFNKPLRLGYIGNISSIEGLDTLIDLINTKETQNKFELHLFGYGNHELELKNNVEINSYKNIFFHGKFERDEIKEIYDKIDVIVIPRKSLEICEKVTPLKPLEAIIYKKPVVCSNVNGILELFDFRTDLINFYDKENNQELLKVLNEISNINKNKLKLQNQKALDFIKINRSWKTNIKKYLKIYNTSNEEV